MAKRLERTYFTSKKKAEAAIAARFPKLREPIIFRELVSGRYRYMVFM